MTVAEGCISSAQAQIAGNVVLATDYRYRGFSLSNGRPAFSMAVSYDHPEGYYADLTGIIASTVRGNLQALGVLAYAGYAHQMASGISWDTGATHLTVSQYLEPGSQYNYNTTELYAGMAGRFFSGHIYFSPDYMGEGVSTVYATAQVAQRLDDTWRLVGQAGVLQPLSHKIGGEINGTQIDFGAALIARIQAYEIKLAWSFGPNSEYPAGHEQPQSKAILSASYYF